MSNTINLNQKFKNTDLFSPAANFFKTHGKYCLFPEGTRDFKLFWDEEENRVLNGYEINGVKITGRHYFYLNYAPIKLVDNEVTTEGSTKKSAVKKEGFPRFLDMDYWFFWELEKAIENGESMIVAKSRRKGFSYKAAAINVYEYEFVPSSTCIIAAFEGEYAITTFRMCRLMVDWIDKHTDWAKKRLINSAEHIKSGYKVAVNGVEIEEGYKSEIFVLKFKDDPMKGIGKTANIFNYEEAGKWPGLIDAYKLNQETTKEGNISVGFSLVWGTGGDMEKSTIDFAEMFYNPKIFGFRPFKNIWDTDVNGDAVCGYFVPDTQYKPPFIDKDGNSFIEKAKNDLLKQREELRQAGKRREFEKFISQRPITPREAFLQTSGNIFPTAQLQEHLSFILGSKHTSNYGKKGKLHFREGKVVFIEDKTLEEAPYPFNQDKREGCVVIYEQPVDNPPFGLYIMATDPYVQDKSEYGDSYGSTFVYKRFNTISDTRDIIVAEYTGRPETLDDYNETIRRLSLYYGSARILYENMFKDLKTYLSIKGQEYLLLDQPIVIRDISPDSKVQRGKGIHMTPPIRRHSEQLLKKWLLEEIEPGKLNLHTIQSIWLLTELIRYNNGGNFDRVDSMLLIMLHLTEVHKIIIEEDKKTERGKMFDKLNSKYGLENNSLKNILQGYSQDRGLDIW